MWALLPFSIPAEHAPLPHIPSDLTQESLMKRNSFIAIILAVLFTLLSASQAFAHGFAGKRFFPATLQTDDPFVADELSLPTLTKNPADPSGGQSYSIETDIAKRL